MMLFDNFYKNMEYAVLKRFYFSMIKHHYLFSICQNYVFSDDLNLDKIVSCFVAWSLTLRDCHADSPISTVKDKPSGEGWRICGRHWRISLKTRLLERFRYLLYRQEMLS